MVGLFENSRVFFSNLDFQVEYDCVNLLEKRIKNRIFILFGSSVPWMLC
jgi:hypothetical protein